MSDILKEIRERHEEHQADIELTEHEVQGMRNDPDVDFEVEYSGADDAHKDRSELLKMVDELQAQQLAKFAKLPKYSGTIRTHAHIEKKSQWIEASLVQAILENDDGAV